MIFNIIILSLTFLAGLLILCGNRVLVERIRVIDILDARDDIDKEEFIRLVKMLEQNTIRMHFLAYIRGKYDRKTFYGIE